MEDRRPLPLALAVALVTVAGLAALIFGLVLVALVPAAGAFLGGALGSIQAGALTITALLSMAYGLVSLVCAAALWKRRPWSWPIAVALQVVVLLAVGVAVLTGGWSNALVIAVLLGVAILALLSVADVRRAVGVGR
jgi:uncharacterized membrane protein